jgi:hypothetical protein
MLDAQTCLELVNDAGGPPSDGSFDLWDDAGALPLAVVVFFTLHLLCFAL